MDEDEQSLRMPMEDSIIYIRAPFSLDRDFASSGEFVEDARTFLILEDAQVEAIADTLEQHSGFLDSETIERVVTPHVEDEELRKRLARLISFLDKTLAQSKKQPQEFVEYIQKRLDEQQGPDKFSEEELERFSGRILSLVKSQPGFKRHRKAKRLYDEIGIPVRDLKIICDLRPVFDKDHGVVEGMILVTTLKVAATDVNGMPITLEAKLTEMQVNELAQKAEEAKQKFTVLRRLMEDKDLPMPFSGK
jgi:hypothetical protein